MSLLISWDYKVGTPVHVYLEMKLSQYHYVMSVERVELFLEIYGNTLVRAATADYYSSKASELIK